MSKLAQPLKRRRDEFSPQTQQALKVLNVLRLLLATIAVFILVLFTGVGENPAHALSRCPSAGSKSGWAHCWGTVRYRDGAKYVGEIRDGKASGRGTYTSRKYGTYVGEFRFGEFHGKGTLSAPNGWKYIGYFRYGKLSGKATAISPNGKKVYGTWRNGRFVK